MTYLAVYAVGFFLGLCLALYSMYGVFQRGQILVPEFMPGIMIFGLVTTALGAGLLWWAYVPWFLWRTVSESPPAPGAGPYTLEDVEFEEWTPAHPVGYATPVGVPTDPAIYEAEFTRIFEDLVSKAGSTAENEDRLMLAEVLLSMGVAAARQGLGAAVTRAEYRNYARARLEQAFQSPLVTALDPPEAPAPCE